MKKNNLINLIILLISELICFKITRINVFSYNHDAIYVSSMNIVQILYFLPELLIGLYLLISTKPSKLLLTNSTIALIIYSIFMHIFIVPIASFFSDAQGVINFVEYASKIYFICLPLVGFRMLAIRKEHTKKSYFLLIFKMILLFLITLVFKELFKLKGVLYAWPLSELIVVLISILSKIKT